MYWKAPDNVLEMLETVLENHPHLEQAKFSVAFTDGKPFVKNRFNWGKLTRFSEFHKIWQTTDVDFCIVLCYDAWHDLLDDTQREAWLDLHCCCCDVEYVPETVEENGKQKVIKDEYGRVKYTDEFKVDDDTGKPKWYIAKMDLAVFSKNVARYGVWCKSLVEVDDSMFEESTEVEGA